jgi:hypothetical protein
MSGESAGSAIRFHSLPLLVWKRTELVAALPETVPDSNLRARKSGGLAGTLAGTAAGVGVAVAAGVGVTAAVGLARGVGLTIGVGLACGVGLICGVGVGLPGGKMLKP